MDPWTWGWFPIAFPFFFVGMWLMVCALLADQSGWTALANRYRAAARPPGRLISGQVVKFGGISENGITRLIVTAEGLFVDAMVLFRFKRPALLIPWREIGRITKQKVLWWNRYELDLAGITSVRITTKAYTALKDHVPAPAFDA